MGRAAVVSRQQLHPPEIAPSDHRGNRCSPGPLEPTNAWYAIAKIAGIELLPGALRQQHGVCFAIRPDCPPISMALAIKLTTPPTAMC